MQRDWRTHLLSDLGFAARVWRRKPAGVAAVVLSLAIAMGIVAGGYSVLDAVILRPFPYRTPERLVYAWGSHSLTMRKGLTSDARESLSSSRSLEQVALFLPSVRASVEGVPSNQAVTMAVQVNFLQVLGVAPFMGRELHQSDQNVQSRAILISFNAWRKYFGETPRPLGATIRLDDVSWTVVGVMPRDFFFPEPDVEFWLPLTADQLRRSPGEMSFLALARLASRQTIETAAAELAINRSGSLTTGTVPTIGLFPLRDVTLNDSHGVVWSLFGSGGFLLLIVWTNVCILLSIQADARRHEIAIRTCLGAPAGRLYRQLLGEHLAVVATAGVLGVAVAHICLAVLHAFGSGTASRFDHARIGFHTYAVLLLLAIAILPITSAVAGRTIRYSAPAALLKPSSLIGSNGARLPVLRGLVLLELTLAPPLLLAAALFFTNFLRVVHTDWGFRAVGATLVDLELPSALERQLQPQIEITEAAVSAIQQLPEVEAVGMGYSVPIRHGTFRRGISISVRGRTIGSDANIAEFRVSPGYFRSLGIALVQGREFGEADTTNSKPVIVINESLAKAVFPDRTPLGEAIQFVHEPLDLRDVPPAMAQTLKNTMVNTAGWEIVGVARDVRMSGLDTLLSKLAFGD
ncbi:MAG TPA: ABC transporter permease [Vicinamibacterales bacterium]